jgi:putative transcriptional regulator
VKGRLLVASPTLLDPNFDRTVVLVLEHSPDGAMGVVLNRPTELRLADALPGWEDVASEPSLLFVGGPVGDGLGVAVTIKADGSPDIVDLNLDPADGGVPSPVRVFLNYSGWGPGQLEEELAVHAWLVVDALPSDVVTPAPDRLWRDVLRRQGGRTAWLANAPPDLSYN